jgi:hypothetical protein
MTNEIGLASVFKSYALFFSVTTFGGWSSPVVSHGGQIQDHYSGKVM